MALDLEEQEQLAELKAWWKQYGNLLINVATAAAVVFIAWFGWNWYQRSQAGQASTVYAVLLWAAFTDREGVVSVLGWVHGIGWIAMSLAGGRAERLLRRCTLRASVPGSSGWLPARDPRTSHALRGHPRTMTNSCICGGIENPNRSIPRSYSAYSVRTRFRN